MLFMTKFTIDIEQEYQWYDVMRECRRCFGQNWRGQSKIRKKFRHASVADGPVRVWFEVPDAEFVSWIGLKTGCAVTVIPNK
jgi:hypothetical protein